MENPHTNPHTPLITVVMLVLDVSKLVTELRRQKAKYHAKTTSTSGIYVNWLRGFDVYDLMPYYVWLYIPEFNYTSLSISLLFGIPPLETEPVNLDFEIELPSLEELLQGILVDISPMDLSKIFEWLKSLEDYILANFVEEAAESMLKTRLHKGVYGQSYYGQAYYDPPAVREFIRSTMLRLWLERRTLKQLRDDVASAASSLGIADFMARYMYDRISLVLNSQTETMVLGYGVLGRSRLGRRGSELAVVPYVDYDGNYREVHLNTLDHVQYGFILGMTPLGFGYLLPKDTVYKKEKTTSPTGYETEAGPPVTKLIDYKARRILSTFTQSAFAFGNYSRWDEQRSYLRSERADQWMELQLLRYHVERMVEPIILKYETNPVKIRMYKSAALQLVSAKAKRHRWGYKGYEAMTEEEFYQWWLQHWQAQGLNSVVLNEIYTRIKDILPRLRWEKWLKGQRLKETRYRLARTTL